MTPRVRHGSAVHIIPSASELNVRNGWCVLSATHVSFRTPFSLRPVGREPERAIAIVNGHRLVMTILINSCQAMLGWGLFVLAPMAWVRRWWSRRGPPRLGTRE